MIDRNLIFETMFKTAKENPTKNAVVSKSSFVLSDTSFLRERKITRAPCRGNHLGQRSIYSEVRPNK